MSPTKEPTMLDLPIHPTLLDPRTGQPLRAIYVTKRGQVVWPQIGGDGTGDGGGGDGGSQGDTGATGGNDGQQQGDGASGGGKEPNITGDFDPDRAKRAIASAREAEKKAKEEARAAQERLKQILKAAGLTPDGKADPEEQLRAAAEERDKATKAARDAALQLAVYRSAGKAGADPDALLDSRTFLSSVAELDPDTADFDGKVVEAIKATLKTNPKLAAGATGQGTGTGRQGADHTGGSGNRARSSSLTDAVKRKLGG